MMSEKKKAVALAGVTASDTAVSGTNYSAASGFVQTMSSREIAAHCDKQHGHVIRDIRAMLDALQDDPDLDHVREEKDLRGYTVEFLLPKNLTLTLITGYSTSLRKRIVDRWQELERGGSIPNTFAAALRLAADQHEQLERQAVQIAQQAPKVALAESICRTDAVCKMGVFAKAIGWGPNRFIERLRNDDILMQNNLPFQRYLDRGYFRVIERKPWTDSTGHQHPAFTTMITGTGQEWLAKRYGKAAGGAGEGF